MPGFDGTGPMGLGPMTGGGRGFCNPYGPLRAAGSMPLAYLPQPVAAPPAAFNPAAPGFGPGYYPATWPRTGVWPSLMGGLPGFWRGRGGRGRGGGHGAGGFRFPRQRGYRW